MKNFVKCALLALLLSGCVSSQKDVVLTFDVNNPTAREIVLVSNAGIFSYQLDENGHAEAVVEGVDAVYARLYYGRGQKKIYVEGGDNASITFDGTDFMGTFDFKGDKQQAVAYLSNVTLTPLPDEAYALAFEEYLSKIEAKRNDAIKLLEANEIKGAGKFVKMEKGRITYAYATPLLMYPTGHRLMAQNPSYMPDDSYYACIDSYFVEDADLVNLDEYRSFIIEASHMLDPSGRSIRDLRQKTAAQMRYIADRFKMPQVRDNLFHHLAGSYVDTFGVDGIQEIESIYKTYVRDTSLLADFAFKCDKWNLSKPGRISPDFKAEDVDGNQYTLADFKGKYIYIDLWATWCNPCRKELPYLKALHQQFEDSDIVFLGLSIDGSRENWKKMLQSGQMTGTQLYIGPRSSFQQAYKIDGIPRFILLDKDGRIISNNMSAPSSPETASYLKTLNL